MTLEDIFEEILTEEIHDEADVRKAERTVRRALQAIQARRAAVASGAASAAAVQPRARCGERLSTQSSAFFPGQLPPSQLPLAEGSSPRARTFAERGQKPAATAHASSRELV